MAPDCKGVDTLIDTLFHDPLRSLMTSKEALLEAFHFRHACKAFDPERKIPDEDFAFLLEIGRLSPASFGFEPWQFVVIQDRALRDRLKSVTWGAQGQLPTASHFVAILARRATDMRHDSPWLLNLMRNVQHFDADRIAQRLARYRSFQEDDFQLADNPRALFDWSCRQCYIALGNMMTAAALIGIDSCPIEGFNTQAAETLLDEAGLLEEGHLGLAVMCAFGYRVKPQTPKLRQPLADLVRWV